MVWRITKIKLKNDTCPYFLSGNNIDAINLFLLLLLSLITVELVFGAVI